MGYLLGVVVLWVLVYFPPPLATLEEHDFSDSLVFSLMRRHQIQNQTADTSELLRIARKRSLSRFPALRNIKKDGYSKALNVSESLGIYRDGYVISLRLGSPPQVFQVYMDTGSDLVWVPCLDSFDCIGCEGYYKDNIRIHTFNPCASRSNKLEPCDSPLCLDIHTSQDSYDTCTMAGCSLRSLLKGTCPLSCPSFSYVYGDGIVTAGLMRDHIVFKGTSPIEKFSKFSFGCAGSSYNEPIGIGGFGKGVLSFPSQLGSALSYRGFSYCLRSYHFERYISNVSSPLVLGASAIPSGDGLVIQYTPMLSNPMYPNFYYIGLLGISIDNIQLELPLNLREFDSNGNGGMIIDSGTTYTHFSGTLYKEFLSILEAIIPYPRSRLYEKRTSFDLCYLVPVSQKYQGFPAINYYFKNNVTLILPCENHFYAFSAAPGNGDAAFEVHCLMLQSSDDVDYYGPAAILGSFQQQNFQVVYDMEKSRIGFEAKDCAAYSHDYPNYSNNYN